MKQRLFNLDYLRGLAALGIMLYHYVTWSYGAKDSASFLERVGTYGVSVFYVLSGITLFYVYYEKMDFRVSAILNFAKKRFFRIFPLLWLVTIAAVVLSKQLPDPLKLFLNLSGLFGFVKWDAYFSPGVWSIGNELVFYAFFPFFVFFSKKSKALMALLSIGIFLVYVYFAFFYLTRDQTLSSQWKNYINPLNQVFLFLGGFLIGLVFGKINFKNTSSLILILTGLLLCVFFPANGDGISLVTGFTRLVFTLSCFLICLGFFRLNFRFPAFIHKPLVFLGEASYSVYLVHPIVFSILAIVMLRIERMGYYIQPYWKILGGILLTLIGSAIIYERFEKFFMRLGRDKSPEKN